MKKILSFFAAALVACVANATVWQITPTSPREKDNIRYCLRDNAQAGDTILLTTDDSPYGESDAIAINKSIVIMPAEGKHPVVNLTYYTKLSAGAIAKIVGLKFDGQGTCEYAFRPYDNSASAVTFEGCEFTGFTKYVITSSEGNHTDSCIINNCYFHDNGRAAVYFPACNLEDATINTVDYVRVTNSTITNITGLNTAIIDVRNHNQDYTENIRLEVDHCTFYNWVGGTNGAIMSYKSPLSSVTNCIFAEPEETAYYAAYCYGGIVKNCLAYNVAGHRDWDTHPQMADNIVGNPLFVNAAEGNLTLGEGSPALTAATDGGAIGDPRWVPSAEPELENGYYLVGTMNNWQVEAEYKLVLNEQADGVEYMIDMTLAEGDEFKVFENNGTADGVWHPGAANYVVDADHVGEATVYFRPNGKDGWYYSVIYVAMKEEPQPAEAQLWKVTAESPTAAGSTLIDDDLMQLASVYLSFVSGTNHTYGEEQFAKAFQIRAKNAPTEDNLTGEENEVTQETKKASPLVLTAKENIEVTFYYRQQQTAETPAAENDSKDLLIFDQSAITTKLTGTHTSVDVSEDQNYAFVTKKLSFLKDHVYTLTALGTTLPLFGIQYQIAGQVPTAISNTEMVEKAVKVFQNGQLMIIKNGVKYNVLGMTL